MTFLKLKSLQTHSVEGKHFEKFVIEAQSKDQVENSSSQILPLSTDQEMTQLQAAIKEFGEKFTASTVPMGELFIILRLLLTINKND